jgi:undecaprenyl-diphosphatase
VLLFALLLGVVEGLTEFLPVSSTGHLILVSSLLGFTGRRAEVFEIFIQLGAILAVCWEYRRRLAGLTAGALRERGARDFVLKIGLAFLPAAAIGLAAHEAITRHLFRPVPVAIALITGAILILIVEGWGPRARTPRVEEVSWRQAALVGVAQCLGLWPGISRSAATILGGLATGLDRRPAVEFSFFLAIPTLAAATCYDLVKNHDALESGDAAWLAVAFAISFLVAWATIRWLLRYVSTHSFKIFAWYRLALAALVLLIEGVKS